MQGTTSPKANYGLEGRYADTVVCDNHRCHTCRVILSLYTVEPVLLSCGPHGVNVDNCVLKKHAGKLFANCKLCAQVRKYLECNCRSYERCDTHNACLCSRKTTNWETTKCLDCQRLSTEASNQCHPGANTFGAKVTVSQHNKYCGCPMEWDPQGGTLMVTKEAEDDTDWMYQTIKNIGRDRKVNWAKLVWMIGNDPALVDQLLLQAGDVEPNPGPMTWTAILVTAVVAAVLFLAVPDAAFIALGRCLLTLFHWIWRNKRVRVCVWVSVTVGTVVLLGYGYQHYMSDSSDSSVTKMAVIEQSLHVLQAENAKLLADTRVLLEERAKLLEQPQNMLWTRLDRYEAAVAYAFSSLSGVLVNSSAYALFLSTIALLLYLSYYLFYLTLLVTLKVWSLTTHCFGGSLWCFHRLFRTEQYYKTAVDKWAGQMSGTGAAARTYYNVVVANMNVEGPTTLPMSNCPYCWFLACKIAGKQVAMPKLPYHVPHTCPIESNTLEQSALLSSYVNYINHCEVEVEARKGHVQRGGGVRSQFLESSADEATSSSQLHDRKPITDSNSGGNQRQAGNTEYGRGYRMDQATAIGGNVREGDTDQRRIDRFVNALRQYLEDEIDEVDPRSFGERGDTFIATAMQAVAQLVRHYAHNEELAEAMLKRGKAIVNNFVKSYTGGAAEGPDVEAMRTSVVARRKRARMALKLLQLESTAITPSGKPEGVVVHTSTGFAVTDPKTAAQQVQDTLEKTNLANTERMFKEAMAVIESRFAKLEAKFKTADAMVEGPVQSRNVSPVFETAVFIRHGTYSSNGSVRRGGGGMAHFVAARHTYDDNNNLIDYVVPTGDAIQVVFARPREGGITGTDGEVTHSYVVAAAHCPAPDQIWYACKVPQSLWDELVAFPVVDPTSYQTYVNNLFRGKPTASVLGLAYRQEIKRNKKVYKWTPVHGEAELSRNENVLKYATSTTGGDCRMTFFISDTAYAGHWSGRVGTNAHGVPAGSLVRLPPNDIKEWKVDAWDANFYKSVLVPAEANVQAAFKPAVLWEQKDEGAKYIEEQKTWPLRTDKGTMAGLHTDYTIMKPSTAMNVRELLEFGNTPKDDYHSKCKWQHRAMMVQLDAATAAPFETPIYDTFLEVTRELGKLNKSAGLEGGSHVEYLEAVGGGDWDSGAAIIARKVCDMYTGLVTGVIDDDTAQALGLCRYWSVFGKTDGYKQKKMAVGRTIQAPCFELKVLYTTLFRDSDKRWQGRMAKGEATWVFSGHDFDQPVSNARARLYRKAKGAIAKDASKFDRRLPAWVIRSYFSYLGLLNPGVPEAVLDFLADVTTHSLLRVSDGTVVEKFCGNPSGFMNTIRLNSYAMMLMWLMCLLPEPSSDSKADLVQLLDMYYIEVCGDDSRVWWFHSKPEVDSFWDGSPWDMKDEGSIDFDMGQCFVERMLAAPFMVSRKMTPMLLAGKWYLFEPLTDASRCARVIMHERNRTEAEEEELVDSLASVVCLVWYQVHMGVYRSAAIETIDRLFFTEQQRNNMKARVANIMSDNLLWVSPLVLSDYEGCL